MTESTCIVDGCDKPRRYKAGWCPMHYQRMKTRGTTDAPPPKVRTLCQCGEPVRCKGLCRKCYQESWRSDNADHVKDYTAAYYQSRADELREYSKAWRRAHPKNTTRLYRLDPEAARARQRKWDDKNRARINATAKAWREKNADKWAMRNRENQRRRRRTDGKPVDFAAILAEHGMFCHICSMVIIDMSQLHFDHVIPLSKGGLHVAENIKPAHAVCNLRKGAKLPA